MFEEKELNELLIDAKFIKVDDNTQFVRREGSSCAIIKARKSY